MTHLDNLIADSLAQSPDTVVHQLASEVVRLRAEIDLLKETAQASAVVVPEIMLSDISDECSAMLCDDREAFRRGALWAQKFIAARARAITTDRVLGEGEERIDSASLDAYKSAFVLAKWASEREISFGWRISFAAIARHFDALRAQPTQEPTT